MSVWLDAASIGGVRCDSLGGQACVRLCGAVQRVAALQHAASLRATCLHSVGGCIHAGDPGQFLEQFAAGGRGRVAGAGCEHGVAGVLSRQSAFAQRRISAGAWLLFVVGIALATLSKGVLGLAMPGVVIFAWLVCESVQSKRIVLAHWLRPAMFTVLALVPLLVWLCFLYGQGGTQSLKDVLWTNSVGRFSGSFEEAGHYEPVHYYLSKLPEAFLPWNVLVYLGLWHFRKQLLANRYLLFFSLWLIAQFLLLSLASSKRMVYLMSLAPAAAVIAAEYTFVLGERLKARSQRSPYAALVVRNARAMTVTGAVLIVAGYLGAAIWLEPRADRQLSFLPLTDKVHSCKSRDGTSPCFSPGTAGRCQRVLQPELAGYIHIQR